MAKRMLADVLWEAANKYLSPTEAEPRGTTEFTCIAANRAADPSHMSRFAGDWLVALSGHRASVTAFQLIENDEERQGVRYMWLLLAMHVAEDEGIEIEVGA
jgi:hypothetical protein